MEQARGGGAGGGSGDKRLVGYVVGRCGEVKAGAGVRAELREYLRRKLPEYMVPAA